MKREPTPLAIPHKHIAFWLSFHYKGRAAAGSPLAASSLNPCIYSGEIIISIPRKHPAKPTMELLSGKSDTGAS